MNEQSEYERRMLLWRDYFKLLMEGIENQTSEGDEMHVWLKVIITEIESSIMHHRAGSEQFARYQELPKDLSSETYNIQS